MKLTREESRSLLELPLEGELEDGQVKSAFKRLALIWHPDKNRDRTEEASEKFKQINAAYARLTGSDESDDEIDEDDFADLSDLFGTMFLFSLFGGMPMGGRRGRGRGGGMGGMPFGDIPSFVFSSAGPRGSRGGYTYGPPPGFFGGMPFDMYDDDEEEDDDFSDDYTESDEWTTDDEYEDPLPRSTGAGMRGRAGYGRAAARDARPAPPPGPPTDNPLLLRFIKQHQL
ncbi:hypothetical protein DUNSADRAFT_5260 [Dunaliella salina]|uniref:J domain-containing protein n=1 Tax=Dunaliella salina TaxID=3046 RepID=A0ABQ7GQP6_DUNSA|nr:hypothetical protein DUNSADRAFT_5260 [Dunaliella salina]|eukprot:KAF5836929.1 hypothetical protein DUNSADRAFT_5260 [Dunaliella salina]